MTYIYIVVLGEMYEGSRVKSVHRTQEGAIAFMKTVGNYLMKGKWVSDEAFEEYVRIEYNEEEGMWRAVKREEVRE